MDNLSPLRKTWRFRPNPKTNMGPDISIRGVRYMLMSKLNKTETRPMIPLGHGDPSAFPCFRTTQVAEDAIVDSIRSANFNGYGSSVGILPARRYYTGAPLHDLLMSVKTTNHRRPPPPPSATTIVCHHQRQQRPPPAATTTSTNDRRRRHRPPLTPLPSVTPTTTVGHPHHHRRSPTTRKHSGFRQNFPTKF
ncbi:hypothetical protein R6Q57_024263 [Mikania cordata]